MLRNLGVLKYQLAFTSLRCLKQVLGFIKRIPVKYFKAKKKNAESISILRKLLDMGGDIQHPVLCHCSLGYAFHMV